MRHARQKPEGYDWVDGVFGFVAAVGGILFCLAPLIYLAVR